MKRKRIILKTYLDVWPAVKVPQSTGNIKTLITFLCRTKIKIKIKNKNVAGMLQEYSGRLGRAVRLVNTWEHIHRFLSDQDWSQNVSDI